MKLVLKYMVTDGCTFESNITLPFEYESIEKAEFDFLELCEAAKKTNRNSYDPINFAGHYFDYSNFYYRKQIFKGDNDEYYSGPEILTLEDWFEKYKGKI